MRAMSLIVTESGWEAYGDWGGTGTKFNYETKQR
jgi:hypothetical protein